MTARIALLLTLAATPAAAAIIPVSNLTDTPLAGSCSLREAIAAANTDNPQGGCPAGDGADTIVFTASGTIALTGSLPQITSAITIDGRGQTVVVTDGRPPSAARGSRGHASRGEPGNGSDASVIGGSIWNEGGVLSVIDCTFAENHATFAGAIRSSGPLTVSRSTFASNLANFGGAINAPVTDATVISNTTFSGNSAGPSREPEPRANPCSNPRANRRSNLRS